MTNACIARVLVVENDLTARSQLIEVLARPGFIVRAADGQGPTLQEEAKKLALHFRPHVVVVDLRLLDDEYDGDRSGLELVKDSNFSSSRCVLYSGHLNYDYNITREAFLEARVADVVGKGDSPQSLINAVEKAARQGCICGKEFSIDWPDAWDEKTILATLFERKTELPSDIVTDILGHLFPDARAVVLNPLRGAAKASTSVFRGRAALFQACADNKEPVIVKLAPRDRTAREVNAYNTYIKDRLAGLFSAQLKDYKIFWELGGICYSFIGSSQKAIETFAAFYRHHKVPEEIIRPLRHFFGEVWKRHYNTSPEPVASNLLSAYDSFLKLRKRLEKAQNDEETLVFPGLPEKYPNPLRWILEHEAESLIPTAQQAITHGDLHGDNLFIEEEHAWAIDFERSGTGPILRDFVELEQDIVTRLVRLPTADLKLFHDLAIRLTGPTTPAESFAVPKDDQDEEIIKCLEVIKTLRSMAREITGYQDIREYYWGLLFDAVFVVLSAEKHSPKWWRGLLFASVLCLRLSHWDNEWPLAD